MKILLIEDNDFYKGYWLGTIVENNKIHSPVELSCIKEVYDFIEDNSDSYVNYFDVFELYYNKYFRNIKNKSIYDLWHKEIIKDFRLSHKRFWYYYMEKNRLEMEK